MKSKRISVILIAVAFMIIVVFSCVGLFSVKKVNVTFAVAEQTDAEKVQADLDGFIGDNLLFLKESEIEKLLNNYHYLEVLSVEKQYPNVINIELKERREVYYINHQDSYFVTTEDGFVLRTAEETEIKDNPSRDKILLELKGLSLLNVQIGEYLTTDNDVVLQSVFEIAKSVNLTDCIKSLTLEKVATILGEGVFDLFFNTYTGVNMRVEGMDNGKNKAQNAFNVYDDILSDYQKAVGTIESYLMQDGKYRVTYQQEEVWTSQN